MSKSDDLQRMREEQHARRERETRKREEQAQRTPAPAPVAVVTAPLDVAVTAPVALVSVPLDVAAAAPVNKQRIEKKPDRAAASTRKKAIATKSNAKAEAAVAHEETGRCGSCGKIKALNRGLVVDHQKGLGKACAGSRKRPA